jgi:thiol:disulfide interchange protein DsbA
MKIARLFAAALFALAATANAAPDNPRPGREYEVLPNPQPVAAAGAKIEVIEFFMYHCPACNAFEPALSDWVKRRSDTVLFRRIHLPHAAENDPEAHLFLTLDAMQLENAMHDKVMRTWHVERRRLKSDADNLDWAANNGLNPQQFRSVYDSFSVSTRLRSLPRLTAAYGVNSTPTLIVNGKYLTNPSMIAQANPGIPDQNVGAATLAVIDALIEKARKDKN